MIEDISKFQYADKKLKKRVRFPHYSTSCRRWGRRADENASFQISEFSFRCWLKKRVFLNWFAALQPSNTTGYCVCCVKISHSRHCPRLSNGDDVENLVQRPRSNKKSLRRSERWDVVRREIRAIVNHNIIQILQTRVSSSEMISCFRGDITLRLRKHKLYRRHDISGWERPLPVWDMCLWNAIIFHSHQTRHNLHSTHSNEDEDSVENANRRSRTYNSLVLAYSNVIKCNVVSSSSIAQYFLISPLAGWPVKWKLLTQFTSLFHIFPTSHFKIRSLLNFKFSVMLFIITRRLSFLFLIS